MRSASLACLGLLVLNSFLLAQTQSRPSIPETEIKGIVTDPTGAVIAGASVVFEGETTTKRLLTGQDGFYHVSLPLGVYRLVVSSPGFKDFEQDGVRISEDRPQVWDVMLHVRSTVCNPCGDPFEIPDNQVQVRADGYLVPTPGGLSAILIRYDHRTQNSTLVAYSGKQPDPKLSPVTVIYGKLTVEAGQVNFDYEKLSLEAVGAVEVKDSGSTKHAEHAKIDLIAGEPNIRLF